MGLLEAELGQVQFLQWGQPSWVTVTFFPVTIRGQRGEAETGFLYKPDSELLHQKWVPLLAQFQGSGPLSGGKVPRWGPKLLQSCV